MNKHLAARLTENAILVALVNNMIAAGFQPAAVWTGEDYWTGNHGTNLCKADTIKEYISMRDGECVPMTLEQVLTVFSDIDMYAPTLHFFHQHKTSWGNHGVMVVPGNGCDFISDWHCKNKAFDKVVKSVASAASDGAFNVTLKVAS